MIALEDRIEIHKYGLTIKDIISLVDDKIQSLSKKEIRTLYVLIRTDFLVTKLHLESMMKWYAEYKYLQKKRLDNAVIVHSLYEKAGVDPKYWQFHWEHYRDEQLKLHYNMNTIIKPIRQDNKTYINRGNGDSNANKIRYPRKCRKTAWKRFYKLFPHLMQKDNV